MPQTKPILLAENEENDVLLTERAFAEAGLREPFRAVQGMEDLFRYLNGEGAYADRNEYPFPYLLLLDVKLGSRNGLDALQWLREHPALRKRLVVVVLSAVDRAETIASAYELGANSYLLKPFDFNELVELARRTVQYWLELNQLPPTET